MALWSGRVDRLSGSRNAIVSRKSISRLDGRESELDNEVNLGPLPQEIVGEEVRFAYEGGTFGLCLDFKYIDKEYLKNMGGRPALRSIEIEPGDILTDVNIPEMVDSGDILLAEHFLSHPADGPAIATSDGQFLAEIGPATGEEWRCMGVVEEPVIQSEVPLPVVVTEVHPLYVETKGALLEDEDELPDIGETVTAITGPQTEMGTLALYETDYVIPVLLEDTEYPSGEFLELQITGVESTHATARAVFSADDFDIIHISEDRIPHGKRQSQNRVIKQEVPIDIKPIPEGATTTNRVIVTDEGTDALVGRWAIQEKIGPVDITSGDEIEIKIRSVEGDSCVGYYQQLPVRVNFDTAVPTEFKRERLSVSIRTVHPDKAIAEPTWITEAQGTLDVRIVGTSADDAIAIREGHLVRIPNTSVVAPGDRVLVILPESTSNDVATTTVAARPVFQYTDGPYLIRLPRIRGDVVQIGGTAVVVDHLPDMDAAVTLGVAEVNEDHIVPAATALPEAHLPDEGTYISAEPKEIADGMVVGVSEELPLKLPLISAAWSDTIKVQVLDRRSGSLFGIVGGVGEHTSDQLGPVYKHLQLAGLALQQTEYRDAAGHLREALQSCPSEFPVIERLLAVHEITIRAILAIRDTAELGQTANTLSQEANRLRGFAEDGGPSGEVGAFLLAREAEMRAAERLLTALDEVDNDFRSDLQMIAQGVYAKAPAIKAAEHLRAAEEYVAETPFEKQIPSPELQSVIQEFEHAFPNIVDELRPFHHSEDDTDWFRYLLPEEILEQTNTTLPNTETDGDTWQRPEVPETMGIVPVPDIGGDGVDAIEDTTTTRNQSEPKESLRSEQFHGSNTDTTESSPTEVDGLKDSATDEESLNTESRSTSTVTEVESPEQAVTAEADSNESVAKTPTDEQTSATEDMSEDETEPSAAFEATSGMTERETAGSEAPNEPLSVPNDSSKLRELREKAEAEASENPEREHIETTASQYQRSVAIREYALERADGNCELCGEAAPFVKADGDPFLEVHHVDELGKGGADHPSLVAAVCPNCHKEIHYGKRGEDLNEKLRKRLEKGLGNVGAADG